MNDFTIQLDSGQQLELVLDGGTDLNLAISDPVVPVIIPYGGGYAVTPSDTQQVLQTKGRMMTQNLVVGEIPQNYGKISWNGSYITVS